MEFIRSKKPSLSIDMAPLIDIVFQLLIFFMLSSSFITPAIKLNLPKAVIQDKRQIERVVVSIDKDGKFYVNQQMTAAEDLTTGIGSHLATAALKSVDLRGDGDASYRYFVQAMDAARQAGATQVNILHGGK